MRFPVCKSVVGSAAVAVALAGVGGAVLVRSEPATSSSVPAAVSLVLASAHTTATSPTGGYWIVDALGKVTAFGGAVNYGSAPSKLNAPIVGIVPTANGDGYWLVGKDGGVFSFGDAVYAGNALGSASDGTVVGIASKPTVTTGPAGPAGPPGARGATGPAGVVDFAEFYALAPPDNAVLVPPGEAVRFPQDGPSDSSGTITTTSGAAFVLAAIGTYQVSFEVPVTEEGQLVVTLNGFAVASSVVGRATGTTEIVGESLITTTAANSSLAVVNPIGESNALNITPFAGGTDPASASLIIEKIG